MPHIVLSLHGNSNRSGALEGAGLDPAPHRPPGPLDAAPLAVLAATGDRVGRLMADPRDGAVDHPRQLVNADVVVGWFGGLRHRTELQEALDRPRLHVRRADEDAEHGVGVAP